MSFRSSDLQRTCSGRNREQLVQGGSGGTDITVLALLFSKSPDIRILQTALHNLQNSNPILRSKLHFDLTSQTFSFVVPESSSLEVKSFDLSSTLEILRDSESPSLLPFQSIIKHEINFNPWAMLIPKFSRASHNHAIPSSRTSLLFSECLLRN